MPAPITRARWTPAIGTSATAAHSPAGMNTISFLVNVMYAIAIAAPKTLEMDTPRLQRSRHQVASVAPASASVSANVLPAM